jgi:hypothetical protein
MCALVLALRKIPIYAPGGGGEPLGGPTNPGYSVAVPDSWATEAREKASKAKEQKRLVHSASSTGKSTSKSTSVDRDEKAGESLNARKPTADAAHRDMDAPGAGAGAAGWKSRNDQTHGSLDESLEHHRSNEIDDLRQGLLKRESTRGRRKPGEAIPPVPSMSGPGFQVTGPSPHREAFGASIGYVQDEEAELGMQHTTSSQALGYGGQTGGGAGYSMFPPPALGSQGAQTQQQQQEQGSATDQQERLRRLSLGLKYTASNSSRLSQ